MSKGLIVQVSFKKTQRDLELYNKVMELDDKSYIIKEALRFYFQNKDKKIVEELAVAKTVDKIENNSIEVKSEKLNNPAVANAINSIIAFGDD